jgi:hypothetical protein
VCQCAHRDSALESSGTPGQIRPRAEPESESVRGPQLPASLQPEEAPAGPGAGVGPPRPAAKDMMIFPGLRARPRLTQGESGPRVNVKPAIKSFAAILHSPRRRLGESKTGTHPTTVGSRTIIITTMGCRFSKQKACS